MMDLCSITKNYDWGITPNRRNCYSNKVSCFKFPGRCSLPLGLEDKRIVDGALSASTYYNHYLTPWLGRINSIRSWSARVNNARQWLQINLGNIARVTGIATQGRRDAHQWVTRYVLSYGDGTSFKAYRERRKIRVRE